MTCCWGFFGFLALASCGQSASREKQAGQNLADRDACDNPDANIRCYFLDMPENLTSVMHIPVEQETAKRLTITGTVFKADGKTPYDGVVLYAYHTDSKGIYAKNGDESGVRKWHGKLHGWCRTNSHGQYEIRTIRPARYPDNTLPAHIHAAVQKPDKTMLHINDFVFSDDSLVNKRYRENLRDAGGSGILTVALKKNGWTGQRDIPLPD